MNLWNIHTKFSAYDNIKVGTGIGIYWLYAGLNIKLSGTDVLKEYANCPISHLYISDADNSLCVILNTLID